MIKIAENNRNHSSKSAEEEWVYYNLDINSKEHYFFKDNHLIKWIKKSV